MQRPLSFTAQQMDNPGQKQPWVLSHLSQRCPHSPTAFEDGDPFHITEAGCNTRMTTLTIPSHKAQTPAFPLPDCIVSQ